MEDLNPCRYPGCKRATEWPEIFCAWHYKRIPGIVRRLLKAHYRPGQGRNGITPSLDFTCAVRTAIACLKYRQFAGHNPVQAAILHTQHQIADRMQREIAMGMQQKRLADASATDTASAWWNKEIGDDMKLIHALAAGFSALANTPLVKRMDGEILHGFEGVLENGIRIFIPAAVAEANMMVTKLEVEDSHPTPAADDPAAENPKAGDPGKEEVVDTAKAGEADADADAAAEALRSEMRTQGMGMRKQGLGIPDDASDEVKQGYDHEVGAELAAAGADLPETASEWVRKGYESAKTKTENQ